MTLIGWAEPPSYDRLTHKLYWARELQFGEEPEHTLNYSIRVLGRCGVLVLNAVASMGQLAAIRGEAGLIVGATAAKAGFFKMLWVGILAFKKVIFAGVIALGAMLKRYLGRHASAEGPQAPENAG